MDDGRRTWSGVGFLKRIQLLFVAAPRRSSAWLRRLPPPPAPSPFPSPLPSLLTHPFVWFLQFLLVRCVFFLRFSLFLILFFSFSFYSEFANELRLKTKITCKVPKEERQRRRREDEGRRGTLPEKVYFIFDIFSQEN